MYVYRLGTQRKPPENFMSRGKREWSRKEEELGGWVLKSGAKSNKSNICDICAVDFLLLL